MLFITIAAAFGGLLTFLPWRWASYPNILGYKSLCTFTPAGSFYCFFLAGLTCTLRATFVKRKSSKNKRERINIPGIIVLLIVLGLAIGSTFWFVSVKSVYTDANSRATESYQ
jgi:hypothetical protein